jgi:hypothetical protein
LQHRHGHVDEVENAAPIEAFPFDRLHHQPTVERAAVRDMGWVEVEGQMIDPNHLLRDIDSAQLLT